MQKLSKKFKEVKFSNKLTTPKFKNTKEIKLHLDDEDEESFLPNQLSFFKQQQTASKLIIPIDQDIREPSYYRGVVQAILDTSEGDVIEFHINSPGGNLSGLQSLLSAIWGTEAETIARISGDCSSAASMLALHCSSVYVSPIATMLVHQVSYSTGHSKNADIKNLVDHISSYSEKLFRETYDLFLSEEEIAKCLDGYQLYLDSEEIMKRLEYKFEVLKEQAMLEMEEAEEEIEQPEQEPEYELEVLEQNQKSSSKKKAKKDTITEEVPS